MSGSGLIPCGIFSFTVPQSQILLPNPQEGAKIPLLKGVGDVSGAKLSPGLRAWLCSKKKSRGGLGTSLGIAEPSMDQPHSQFSSSSSQEPHSKSSSSNSSPVQLQTSLIPALKLYFTPLQGKLRALCKILY